MSKKGFGILIVAFCLIGIMATMLIVFLNEKNEDFDNELSITVDGNKESLMQVRDLQLVPGQSQEYKFILVGQISGTFDITLEYLELEDGGLGPFVDVTISTDTETIHFGKLEDLLDKKDEVIFQHDFVPDEVLVIVINYTMPLETGNEAQLTYSDFNLKLLVEKA
jgi:hypothetical protein